MHIMMMHQAAGPAARRYPDLYHAAGELPSVDRPRRTARRLPGRAGPGRRVRASGGVERGRPGAATLAGARPSARWPQSRTRLEPARRPNCRSCWPAGRRCSMPAAEWATAWRSLPCMKDLGSRGWVCSRARTTAGHLPGSVPTFAVGCRAWRYSWPISEQ
jgi:hypothetical protein